MGCDLGVAFEDLGSEDGLEEADDVTTGVLREGLEVKVDMVLVETYLLDVEMETMPETAAEFSDRFLHFRGECCVAVCER